VPSKYVWRTPLFVSALLFSALPASLFAADAPAEDQRTLLTIPFEDREDILRVMRGNLDQVRQIIEALSRQDYAAIERIADQLSFDRKKADGLARRGNAGYAAMGVQLHAVGAQALKKAAQTRDPTATLNALGNVLATCVACHGSYRVTEWPEDKTYRRPQPVPMTLPEGVRIADPAQPTSDAH
jgi:cytochrome c556